MEWQSDNTSLPYNVEIRSDQWASDVNATNGDGWKQPGFVLDGGYIYQLSTAARGGEEAVTGATIKLTGYYPSIRDSQRYKVYSADPKWTEDNGKAEFDAIVQNTLDRANAATMKQYLDVYKGRGKQTALNGTEVYPGATLGSEYGSSKCAEDSKYYLRDTDGTNSNHVTGELKGTATKVYDFYSDYKGNILMNGTVILKQGDGLDKLPREAKVIDQYTKVITNLVGAITRNQGHDE